jgi:hypothetical protein
VITIVTLIKKDSEIDYKNIYAIGLSNGGFWQGRV